MCFSGLIISSRILWMNFSRLLPQFVSMYFGGFLAGFIGSVCLLFLFLTGVCRECSSEFLDELA